MEYLKLWKIPQPANRLAILRKDNVSSSGLTDCQQQCMSSITALNSVRREQKHTQRSLKRARGPGCLSSAHLVTTNYERQLVRIFNGTTSQIVVLCLINKTFVCYRDKFWNKKNILSVFYRLYVLINFDSHCGVQVVRTATFNVVNCFNSSERIRKEVYWFTGLPRSIFRFPWSFKRVRKHLIQKCESTT